MKRLLLLPLLLLLSAPLFAAATLDDYAMHAQKVADDVYAVITPAKDFPNVENINMPDMDGITATTAILERTPFTQIVVLTVQNAPDYMRRAMMAGARDFITKPPALDDLLNAVLQAGKIAHQGFNGI